MHRRFVILEDMRTVTEMAAGHERLVLRIEAAAY